MNEPKKSIDEGIVKRYADLIPKEMRDAIQELSNNQRWAIYIALYFKNRMYFTEIKDMFKANPNTINSNLKALMMGGLAIRKTAKLKDAFDNNKVFYELSPKGQKFLTSLFEIAYPEKKTSMIGPGVIHTILGNSQSFNIYQPRYSSKVSLGKANHDTSIWVNTVIKATSPREILHPSIPIAAQA